ncbi:hypothetical protein BEN48_14260 [Hymenobacter glacialis]|uniref:Uncharacterized protein n=1 Tax=Hymenobacter glacialis TaxID=1908236 RepID=A0A1G1T4F8_9BACT|nr:hypothetical protein BEN48_14260 [Hymenobacter glacialis]
MLILALLSGQLARAQDYRTPPGGGGPTKVQPVDMSKYFKQPNAPAPSPPKNGTEALGSRAELYLFPRWTQGVLRPYTGAPRREWLKYNAVDHQLIYRTLVGATEVVKVVDTDLLREFSVGDSLLGQRLTFRRYLGARMAKPALRKAFFEVHYDAGKTALLCQRTHVVRAGEVSHGLPGTRDVLTYFLKTTDNQLTPVKLSPAPFLAALGPAHADALAAYARAQQLDLRRETDAVRLLVYYDSL